MTAAAAFLLAFPSLFSIIDPLAGALIFGEATRDLTHEDKVRIAGRVALYSLLVMLAALWGGTYVLNFFGVSLGALRIAGGTVVALIGWHMLMAPNHHSDRTRRQAGADVQETKSNPLEMAFFPLTMPFTTGPGTIAVAITLGAERPARGIGLLTFFAGVSAAAVLNAAIVWVAYRFAASMTKWMGPATRPVVSQLIAFLLLCIGVQILIAGVGDVVVGWRAQ